MQKIILDKNVIVSALISNSVPTQILYKLVLTKSVLLCLSDDVFDEYIGVLGRDKFSKFKDFRAKADVVLAALKSNSLFFNTDIKVDVLTDTSDNKFLELAAASSADFLITGNTLEFTLDEFEYTKILTPRAYWELIIRKNELW